VIALLTTVVVTVGLSVFLHGFTSVPLVAAYRRWYGAHAEAHPKAAEAAPARLPRRRQQPAADEAGLTLRDAGAAPRG
jgi:peptidoglycan/LPS O-acetylase OafA/YrhL